MIWLMGIARIAREDIRALTPVFAGYAVNALSLRAPLHALASLMSAAYHPRRYELAKKLIQSGRAHP
jgi:hypothetical protein